MTLGYHDFASKAQSLDDITPIWITGKHYVLRLGQ